MEWLIQCWAFSFWDQSAPFHFKPESICLPWAALLKETEQESLINAHDSDCWGKSSRSTTLQMISPKHHPYKWRLIQSLCSFRKTRNFKEAGRLKGGRWRVSDPWEPTGFWRLRGHDAPWPAHCRGGKRRRTAMLSESRAWGGKSPCTDVSMERGWRGSQRLNNGGCVEDGKEKGADESNERWTFFPFPSLPLPSLPH